MGASDWLSFASCIVAGIAVVISILTSKRRLEFTCSHRAEILQWHQQCVEELTLLRTCNGTDFSKEEHLAKLSSLVEAGRFYFPNKPSKMLDGYGKEKETAYQGKRDIALDYLVFSHQILSRENCLQHDRHLRMLSRFFTSRVFDLLDPRKHNKRMKLNTFFSLTNIITIEDILSQNADALEVYIVAEQSTREPAVSVEK